MPQRRGDPAISHRPVQVRRGHEHHVQPASRSGEPPRSLANCTRLGVPEPVVLDGDLCVGPGEVHRATSARRRATRYCATGRGSRSARISSRRRRLLRRLGRPSASAAVTLAARSRHLVRATAGRALAAPRPGRRAPVAIIWSTATTASSRGQHAPRAARLSPPAVVTADAEPAAHVVAVDAARRTRRPGTGRVRARRARVTSTSSSAPPGRPPTAPRRSSADDRAGQEERRPPRARSDVR